jgi:hypothetical protein
VERVVLNALAKRAALPPDIAPPATHFPSTSEKSIHLWHTCAHEDIAAGTAASTLDGGPTIAGGDTPLRDVLPFTYHQSLGDQGLGLGRGVGRPLGVGILLGVGVGRGVAVAVAVAVGVAVGVGVPVAVGVAVGVTVGVDVGVGLPHGTTDGPGVGCGQGAFGQTRT